MEYKLMAVDMDGTILNSAKKISAAVRAAVDEATRRGKIVAYSTGRGTDEVAEHFAECPNIRYVNGECGTLIFDAATNKIIARCVMPEAGFRQVIDLLAGGDYMSKVYIKGSAYADKSKMHDIDRYQMHHVRTMHIAIPTADYLDFLRANIGNTEKMVIYAKSEAEKAELKKILPTFGLTAVNASKTSVEVYGAAFNKATGLKLLCDYLQIDISEAIAIGDADNDREVMGAAGLAIAMGNAEDSIKKIARHIVSDNNHDGVAEAIYKYLLGSV